MSHTVPFWIAERRKSPRRSFAGDLSMSGESSVDVRIDD